MMQPAPSLRPAVWYAGIAEFASFAAAEPDAAATLSGQLRSLARQAAAEYGALAVTDAGAGAVAEFGSVDAAIRSALRLRAGFREVQRRAGRDEEIQVGLHVGESVRTAGGGISGEAVSVAARIVGVAPPGEVVASDEALEALEASDAYVTRSRGRHHLKGLGEAVQLHAVYLGSEVRGNAPETPEAVAEALAAALGPSYSAIEPLGEGGMALVFRAVDTRLGRAVAVKVMSPSLRRNSDARERFIREARAAAALSHPSVVPIFAVDALPDGLPYFTMQYLGGGSLERLLREEGTLAPARVAEIVGQVASALAAAHARGIVHRDVKPQNILLDPESGRALLTDFGIAKGADETATTLTQTGSLMGSPLYMSPEQVAGEPLDPRSDLYSLGVVAYELLAGQPPFMAASFQRLNVCHLTQAPRPVREHRPDCPEALAAIVHRCLEKEPGRRFTSASEVVTALDAASGRGARRAAGSRASALLEDPMTGFQVTTLAALGASGAALAVDSAMGAGYTLSVLAVLAATLLISERASRLWVRGYELRQFVSLSPGRPRSDMATAWDVALGGRHAKEVRESRALRALCLRIFETLAHSEQADFPRLRPTVEELHRDVVRTAREIAVLERRYADSPDGSSAATTGGARQPSHHPEEVRAARLRLEAQLASRMEGLRGIQASLARYSTLGGTLGPEPVQESLTAARAGLEPA